MIGVIELIILAVCLVVMVRLFTSASFRAVAKALLAIPAILLVAAVAVMVLRIAPHAHRQVRSVEVHGPMNTYPRTAAEARARNPRVDFTQFSEVWGDYMEPGAVDSIPSSPDWIVVHPPTTHQHESPEQELGEALPATLATVTEPEVAKEAVIEQASGKEVASSAPKKGEAELRSLIRTVARAMLAALDEDAADTAAALPAASGKPGAESVSLAANTVAETETRIASPRPAARPIGPRKTAPERSTRPDWVGEPPRRVGDAYQVSLDVDPYTTIEESDSALPAKINAAVDDYVGQLIGLQARGRIRLPMEYIDEHVKRDDWQEWRKHAMGPVTVDMVHRHVLLRFDNAVNDHIRQMWKRSIVNERVAGAAALGGGVLALVAMIYGYLRLDLATRGAYRRRIRWTAAAAALLAMLVVAAAAVIG